MSAVVTRIAPSPTGAMHIGNARSALFNWLYARHTGGRFLLRIEDTDRARSTEAAVQVIFDSLQWLGLEYDGAPVFQFVRADRHRDVARELVERGWAYRCWMTAEQTEEAKTAARAAGHALRSPWRDRGPDPGLLAQPHVVRFKTPNDGETVIEDAVRGTVAFPNKDLEDLIIL
ncbi:MAG TPA: glutamate--tRNA ligase family protein, partial [Caulobacteraceae bacterium]|nr:glutamate--tRNA ligase family protein [Caulobacteraceae bacterium]